jgi:taurine-pyruvate aminotransferase
LKAKSGNDLLCLQVVCGFGRLGARFGFEAYGFEPDMLTMAKALTSSYAPMGARARRRRTPTAP